MATVLAGVVILLGAAPVAGEGPDPGALPVPERVTVPRVVRATPAQLPPPTSVEPEDLWPARIEVVPYTLQAGDSLEAVAERFGLQVTTLIWSNPELEENPELLSVGQTLLVPPLDGLLHVVQPRETLESIAAAYQVEPGLIAWFPSNRLGGGQQPYVAQRLIVPGGRKAFAPAPPAVKPPAPSGGEASYFGWPAAGSITTRYSGYHGGIDIAGRNGQPIFATQAGRIVFSGWDYTGYGYTIIIDHENGWRSRYAHLSGTYHERGTWVKRGQLIATMGSTGRSTGPHLHFELLSRGYRYNPLTFLP